MSLIKCPECGKENVSDSAVSCPECGYAIKEHFDKIRLEEQRIAEENALKERKEAELRYKKKTEGSRQQETIKVLESRLAGAKKESVRGGIGLAISLPLTILFWCLSSKGSLGILIVICAFASFASAVFLINGINEQKRNSDELEIAKRDINEYEERMKQQSKIAAAQAQTYAAKNASKHPKCPMCGSTNTEKIGTINRAASVAAVGLASSKIGKQYQCKNCKHKW